MFDYKDKLIFKVLGSGCCVPRLERGSPGNIIKYKDRSFLLDCGAGVLRQLVRAKEDYKTLTGVIFSHFHPDHSSDFIPLIQALDYTPGFKREQELLLIGPVGLEKFCKSLYEIFHIEPIGFNVKYIELEGRYDISDELFIEGFKGNHTDTSVIVKVLYKDQIGKERGFVYSGDTDFDLNISDFASKIELLVLECSLPFKAGKHLTPEEAGQIAQKAQPGKLLLTHFYPPADNPDVKIQHRVKEYFIGQVLLAQDYTEIVI